jgi:nicotinate-nucleotide adenylyltransferase
MRILKKQNFIGNDDHYQNILKELPVWISPARVSHSLEVSKLAQTLCSRYNVEFEKGKVAGIGHDIARELTGEQLIHFLCEKRKRIGNWEKEHPVVLHGIVGRIILSAQYGIEDKDILDAVSDHVLGRSGMGTLSQILFVADFLEPTRRIMSEEKRLRFLELPLPLMLIRVTEEIFNFLAKDALPIAPVSIKMYEYFKSAAVEES